MQKNQLQTIPESLLDLPLKKLDIRENPIAFFPRPPKHDGLHLLYHEHWKSVKLSNEWLEKLVEFTGISRDRIKSSLAKLQ